MEGRPPVKGNATQHPLPWTQSQEDGRLAARERIRQAVRRRRKDRLTSLYHHIYQVAHLREAYFALQRQAAPGVDGVTWQHYGQDLDANLQDLSQRLARGAYRATAVRRAYIPKPDGRQRPLGVPALEDKIVQCVTAWIFSVIGEEEFRGFSYGFRPGRGPHHALDAGMVGIHRKHVNWILDADIQGFFDHVSHAWLVRFVEHRIGDTRVIRRIQQWLTAGVLEEERWTPSEEGVPQGGLLSPLLAHLLLDELDKELEKRGHRFARYADDANIYVRSRQAGARVMASVRRVLERELRLTVNETKSAVDRPWNRTFLGFTFTRRQSHRRLVNVKALKAFKAKVRELTGRTRGRTIRQIVQELRQLLLGWRGFFGVAEVRSPLRDLDKWIRRRLRSYHWKQWGRRG